MLIACCDRRRFDLSIVFAMSIRVVTVFGGTGFLGRRVVRHLRKHEFSVRIASRHLDRGRKLFGFEDPCLQSIEVDTRDEPL
jgi:NADH dehydrogenase